jgi:hypothetical protein
VQQNVGDESPIEEEEPKDAEDAEYDDERELEIDIE